MKVKVLGLAVLGCGLASLAAAQSPPATPACTAGSRPRTRVPPVFSTLPNATSGSASIRARTIHSAGLPGLKLPLTEDVPRNRTTPSMMRAPGEYDV